MAPFVVELPGQAVHGTTPLTPKALALQEHAVELAVELAGQLHWFGVWVVLLDVAKGLEKKRMQ